jgi:hypothetical protein
MMSVNDRDTQSHVRRYFDKVNIDNTLLDLIDLRERIYAVHIAEYIGEIEARQDAEKDLHELDLLDRTIAYVQAKRDRDAEREMHKQGIW